MTLTFHLKVNITFFHSLIVLVALININSIRPNTCDLDYDLVFVLEGPDLICSSRLIIILYINHRSIINLIRS